MKNRIVIWLILLLAGFAHIACEELETVRINENVEPNTLQPLSSTDIVLTFEEADENAVTFTWTATDFGFQAGTVYTIEMDVAGNNFANAFELEETRNLTASVSVRTMNNGMLALGQNPFEPANMEFRVISVVSNNVAPVFSTTRTASVTPFATSFPSIWGMGSGLKGWGPWPDNAVEWSSQQFKKYEQIAYFTNGEAFRFFEQLDWGPVSYNYPYFTSVSPVFENANDGDSNLRVAGATGWYLVKVDLIAKTVTAEATQEPLMYMTGAGIGGWDTPGTGASIKMTYVRPGVFFATANFVSGEAFRFFAQADWGPTSYNYPYFTTVSSLFENASDGDSNLRYTGTTGPQTVIVDINEGTVVVVPPLYMTGAGIGGWDQPGTGVSIKMAYVAIDTYEATATFYNGETFRFFAQDNWGPTSYNYPYFTTVASDFEHAEDGDSNLRYIGETGSRTVKVNLATKVVTLN
ncbi:MAG: SusE domain-containing protein [Cyclobacteriaceae bacterium]|nr:SusE domain-containing protein [Cyclobacteriaceae bacterium]